MRTVFFGTSEYAATVLRRLASGDHRPALVVTPPDRRQGRGRRLAPVPAAQAAEQLGIEVLKTEATEEPRSLELIRAAAPQCGVVCAFGQLLREPLLSELELLNVHPSLLPRWRGAAPIERAIMAGDERTGVSIMRVTEGLDSGPVALREAVQIDACDYGELAGRLAELGGELVVAALELRASGRLEFTDQDEAQATYAEKVQASERRLDPRRPALELERVVRALSPHVGAYLGLEGDQRLGVLEARAIEGDLEPGAIEVADGLRLGCGEGVLWLARVRPPGGKVMDAEAYLRGHSPPRVA